MKVDRDIQQLVDEVKSAGWTVTFISNNCRIMMRGPKGQQVICAVTAKTPHTVKGIRKELARKGCNLGYSQPPRGAVGSAMMEAIARRERKLTPQECGEDREPAEVIIRHPKGTGTTNSETTTVSATLTLTTPTGGDMANPGAGETFKHTRLSDALAAGVNVSQKIKDAFEDDLTCKTCGQTIATLGACGRHLAMHEKKAIPSESDVAAALETLTKAFTAPVGNNDEVADLKRRLKMVKQAMGKDIMTMATQIGRALDGLDL